MDNVFSCNFPNFGFVGCDLSEEDMAPIMEEVDLIQNDFENSAPMNQQLVGHIRHEYRMLKTHKHIESLAIPLAHSWYQGFNRKFEENKELFLIGSWINFQKKYEFNPLHNHDGEFSFVIYCKIPYTMVEEQAVTNYVDPSTNVTGNFTFQYIDVLGSLTPWTIPTDKSFERKMILFPAQMMHSVNPFYSSDEYRISISGNLHFRLKDGNNTR
jgi:hypothetical protein